MIARLRPSPFSDVMIVGDMVMEQEVGASSGSTSLRSPEPVPVSALSGNDPARDLDDAYQCVDEALDYFESHRLATWAPVAELFVRERKRGRVEGVADAPRLFAALDLAANRLLACSVNAIGTRESSEYSQWAREAREAAEALRDRDGGSAGDGEAGSTAKQHQPGPSGIARTLSSLNNG